MDSLAFLKHVDRRKPLPVYVVHGDEEFLKRQVLAALRGVVLGEGDTAFGLSIHSGDKATLAGVRDELETLPFLTPCRLVVVENADPFVSQCRAHLEKYVAKPAPTGVLVLEVKSWPGTTRLAKLLEGDATIVCKTPAAHRLAAWCVEWAAAHHGKQLVAEAAKLLVDLIGSEMGLLDQELGKLAVYVGGKTRIETIDVDKLVGNSRTENMWKIFDAIGTGNSAEALTILGRLFEQGEEPLRVLGAFSMQLRRLAQAARWNQQGQSLDAALSRAGVPPFAHRSGAEQLRHLGRQRIDRLHDWLLETDLGLKGASQLPPRTVLERLVIRLAHKSARGETTSSHRPIG
ncbi:MAG TPA: DNA polymerase III subunit delta [Gemmataceae bacterium]|nr:DNA polymerase III subunit delta [Gemmataceae bacterium]